MASNGNNKRAVESILVASGNRALVNATGNGGALPGGGTRASATANIPLMSAVNAGYVNLFDGQLGIFAGTASGIRGLNNCILTTTDTTDTVPTIYIAQGTSTAQTPGVGNYPLTNNRPYESSGLIDSRNLMVLTARVAKYPRFNCWSIGRTSAINTSDETEYTLRVAYHGQVYNTENSMHSYASNTFGYTTPDYTTLALTDDLDHFVKNFVYNVNINSRQFRGSSTNWKANEPVVAFAVATTGNGGQTVNTTTPASYNVFIDANNIQRSMQLSTGMLLSLQAAIPNTHGILNVDLSTAGSAAEAEYFVIMALDRERAFEDRIKLDKIRLGVGLQRGFISTVSKTEETKAFEGEGLARQWQLYYDATAGQRKYAQFQRQEFPFIEVASSIEDGVFYDAYILEHRSYQTPGIGDIIESPKKTIVLIPACDDTTRDSFEAYINQWIATAIKLHVEGNTAAANARQVDITTGGTEIVCS